MRAAAELGIRVPLTQSIESAEDFHNPKLEWPAVLKIDGTWGGEGVSHLINPTRAEEVLSSMSGARTTVRAWKHFLINRRPLALWLWRRRSGSVKSLQKFISGRQANTMFASWQGEVLASVTVEVLATQELNVAATILRLLRNEEIERASRLLAQRFKLSGFHGLDFILEDSTGDPYLIEMNPRATQLGHLNAGPQGSLADALAARLVNRTALAHAGARLTQSDTIALFPHAWKSDPGNKWLTCGYHDVPWEQPALVIELMRKSWPERLLLNRVLTGLRALRPRSEKPANHPSAKERSTLAT